MGKIRNSTQQKEKSVSPPLCGGRPVTFSDQWNEKSGSLNVGFKRPWDNIIASV